MVISNNIAGEKVDCVQIKDIIPHYINHTASKEDIQKVEEHLSKCENCRNYLSTLWEKDDREIKQLVSSQNKRRGCDLFTIFVLGAAGVMVIFLVSLLFRKG